MSYYVGAKMPKGCGECTFSDPVPNCMVGRSASYFCRAVHSTKSSPGDVRPEWCPLVETREKEGQ